MQDYAIIGLRSFLANQSINRPHLSDFLLDEAFWHDQRSPLNLEQTGRRMHTRNSCQRILHVIFAAYDFAVLRPDTTLSCIRPWIALSALAHLLQIRSLYERVWIFKSRY